MRVFSVSSGLPQVPPRVDCRGSHVSEEPLPQLGRLPSGGGQEGNHAGAERKLLSFWYDKKTLNLFHRVHENAYCLGHYLHIKLRQFFHLFSPQTFLMSGGRFDALFRGGGGVGGKGVGGKGVGGGAASLTFQAVSKEEEGRYSIHERGGFFSASQTVLEYGGQSVTVDRLPVF